ncbi:portal protein [Tenacibaculum phage JQ]|nr:portal protein [Tenacibaculum phage JQ]
MGLFDWLKSAPLYIRYQDGTHYTSKNSLSYENGSNLMQLALTNPVLFSAVNIRANYLSKFKFYIERPDGTRDYDAKELDIINKPNYYQSKEDLLKQFEWYLTVYGFVYQKPFGATGQQNTLYNLNPAFIDFDDKKKPFLLWKSTDINDEKKRKFNYDDNGTNRTFSFKEIIPYYDIANGLQSDNNNMYKSPSRLKAVLKQISNVNLATDAENRVIQTNGREAIFRKSVGTNQNTITTNAKLPVDKEDKENILFKLNTKYNVSKGNRTIVPDYPLEHLDMSINAKNLGLHESIIANSGLIIKALGLNNEIYNYYNKGATFENQDAAEVRMLQNVMQPIADNIANSISSALGMDNPIKASIDHVPTMQVVEDKRAERMLKISTAMRNLIQSGLSTDAAITFMQENGINIENE